MRGLLTGSLRIGTYPVDMQLLPFPVWLADFSRAHPGLEITVKQAGGLAMARMVAEGELDCSLLDPLPGKVPGLRILPLASETLMVACPAGHPLASEEDITLERLSREPFDRDRPVLDHPDPNRFGVRRRRIEPADHLRGGRLGSPDEPRGRRPRVWHWSRPATHTLQEQMRRARVARGPPAPGGRTSGARDRARPARGAGIVSGRPPLRRLHAVEGRRPRGLTRDPDGDRGQTVRRQTSMASTWRMPTDRYRSSAGVLLPASTWR